MLAGLLLLRCPWCRRLALSLLLRLLAPVEGIAALVQAFVLHAAFRCACVGHIASQACWQGGCSFIMAAASFRFAVFCLLVTVGAALPSASTVDAQMIRNSCFRLWPALCVVQPCFVLQAIVLQVVSHAAAANAACSNSERHHGGGVACGFVCAVLLCFSSCASAVRGAFRSASRPPASWQQLPQNLSSLLALTRCCR